MKVRIALLAAAVPVVAAGAWFALHGGGPVPDASMASAVSKGRDVAAPSRGGGAFAVAARKGAAPPAPAGARVPVRSTLLTDYVTAKSYRALYDRLSSSTTGRTAEGLYVLHEILRKCANVPDRPWGRGSANAKPVDQRRTDFLAGLQPNDPQRARRIAAFEDVAIRRCAGMESVTVSQAELNKLLADAASAGDPKARAAMVEQEIWDARRGGHWHATTLSDVQIDQLRGAIDSRDPEAMVVAGRLLSNTWRDLTVRVGPDGLEVEPRAFYNAWQVLACSYGYPCERDNPRLLDECAYNGHCEASSLPDYLYYYGSSPHESQLITYYQSVLRNAIETGDWSQVTFARGTRATGASRFVFAPGPR